MRRRRHSSWGYERYPTYAQPTASAVRHRAASGQVRLQKSSQAYRPIVISGRKLAQTWWGTAWNENLERYADYSNRIGRGRTYVRSGAVLDLQIEPGLVKALVQGSRVTPYRIEISISPLGSSIWDSIVKACAGQIGSLGDLVEGRFPSQLAELFTARGKGLFPAPSEINLSCSCPDWADMCKHVAAALYGVGVRLDEDPTLFFTLRQVDIGEIVSQAVRQKSSSLLQTAARPSRRALKDDHLAELFGIDLGQETEGTADQEGSQKSGAKSAKTAPDITELPARKRGRPAKAATQPEPAPPARKRGRPAKAATQPEPAPPVRKRGRPAKKIMAE
jgi:uncharacterized Zn finger protein